MAYDGKGRSAPEFPQLDAKANLQDILTLLSAANLLAAPLPEGEERCDTLKNLLHMICDKADLALEAVDAIQPVRRVA